MGDNKRTQRRFWPTRIYDYNYKVSEGYYKPQKNFMDTGSLERLSYSPPKHQSYAERFAANPWYGEKRGLPYTSSTSALNEPLLKPSERPRSSSLLREMKDQAANDVPLHIRANRRRRRFEDEDEALGIRPRASRRQTFETSEQYRLPPRYKDVGEKLRSLDAELIRLAPRRQSANEDSYLSSSYNDKPPASPRARKISYNEELTQLPPRPRARISSVGEIGLMPRSRRTSITEDEESSSGNYTTRSQRFREERRLKESREITDGIHKMIEKMRTNKLNPEDGYFDRKERGIRPHAIDPKLREEQKHSDKFVYGDSRKY